MQKITKININEFENLCGRLYDKIEGKFKYIYPVFKNGLFVAELLKSYSGNSLQIIYSLEGYNKSDVLVVDDLVDSGKTLIYYSDYSTAVLFKKEQSIFSPDFFVEQVKNEWIEFFWEKPTEVNDLVIRLLEMFGKGFFNQDKLVKFIKEL